LVSAAHGEGKPGGVQRWGKGFKSVEAPLGTVTAGGSGGQSVATAFLAQANGGFNTMQSRAADAPVSTVTNKGSQQQLVTANLVQLSQNCDARAMDDPLRTVRAGGQHHGLVTAFLSRQFGNSVGQPADQPAPTVTAGGGGKSALVECVLSPELEAGALRCAAFLVNYYGNGDARDVTAPLDTVTTKDRLALVTVWISGDPYVIVDIRLRMLKPRELYRAQGFPDSYIIDRGHDGRPFTKSEQVHMCGNSVSPGTMAAIASANNPWAAASQEVSAA
jgi:DNA (cytosine-5)-methyltransferase 1